MDRRVAARMKPTVMEARIRPIPEHLPARWLATAIISIGEDGMPVATPGQFVESRLPPIRPDDFVVVLRHVHGIGHYFHFMELLLILHSIRAEYLRGSRVARIHVGCQLWNNMRQHGLQLELLRILYSGGHVIENIEGSAGERNVLVIDKDYSSNTISQFLQPMVGLAATHFPDMRRRVLGACGMRSIRKAHPAVLLRVLYVHRNHARSMDPTLRDQLMRWLEDRDYAVTTVDFATISWKEQVAATHAADVVIGVHGNGLTNVLWATPHAAVVELFPAGCHNYTYMLLCEVARLTYLGLEGVAEDGFVTRDHCRVGPARGKASGHVTALPWDTLGAFLDAHRATVQPK